MKPISVKWQKFVARMQGVACETRGYSIVRVAVLVGPNGDPEFWTAPEMDKIEPSNMGSDVLRQIILNLRAEMPQLDPDET